LTQQYKQSNDDIIKSIQNNESLKAIFTYFYGRNSYKCRTTALIDVLRISRNADWYFNKNEIQNILLNLKKRPNASTQNYILCFSAENILFHWGVFARIVKKTFFAQKITEVWRRTQ